MRRHPTFGSRVSAKSRPQGRGGRVSMAPAQHGAASEVDRQEHPQGSEAGKTDTVRPIWPKRKGAGEDGNREDRTGTAAACVLPGPAGDGTGQGQGRRRRSRPRNPDRPRKDRASTSGRPRRQHKRITLQKRRPHTTQHWCGTSSVATSLQAKGVDVQALPELCSSGRHPVPSRVTRVVACRQGRVPNRK